MSDSYTVYHIVMEVIFSLLFLFFAYMTMLANKKGDKIIIMMLISLTLAALTRMVEYVLSMTNEH